MRRPRWPRVPTAVWVVVLLTGLAAGIGVLFAAQQRAYERRVGQVEGDLGVVADALDKEQTATEARGDQPVTPPADQIVDAGAFRGAQGERGAQGAAGERGPGPTDDQVRKGVAGYFAEHPPTPGQSPTEGMIAQAVAAYCTTKGDCRGPAGGQGAGGQSGPPGQTVAGPAGAQGPSGPGPSNDQVAGAVGAFCAANNGCAGPTGPTGAQGPGGPPGPPVGSFTFTVGIVVYTCVDSDANGAYECSAALPPP